jgi:uncharacterized protein YktA (UPF0223 family)
LLSEEEYETIIGEEITARIKISQTRDDIADMVEVLNYLKQLNNSYPDTIDRETILQNYVGSNQPKSTNKFKKHIQYRLKNIIKHANGQFIDRWGNPYIYLFSGKHQNYKLYSLGSDGIESNDNIGNP